MVSFLPQKEDWNREVQGHKESLLLCSWQSWGNERVQILLMLLDKLP